MPGSSVLHYLLEFAQIHVHGVSDAIQPSHPLLPPSPFVCTHSIHTHTHTCAWSLQSCLTLYDLIDYSLSGSSVHGILLEKERGKRERESAFVIVELSRQAPNPREGRQAVRMGRVETLGRN